MNFKKIRELSYLSGSLECMNLKQTYKQKPKSRSISNYYINVRMDAEEITSSTWNQCWTVTSGAKKKTVNYMTLKKEGIKELKRNSE